MILIVLLVFIFSSFFIFFFQIVREREQFYLWCGISYVVSRIENLWKKITNEKETEVIQTLFPELKNCEKKPQMKKSQN